MLYRGRGLLLGVDSRDSSGAHRRPPVPVRRQGEAYEVDQKKHNDGSAPDGPARGTLPAVVPHSQRLLELVPPVQGDRVLRGERGADRRRYL